MWRYLKEAFWARPELGGLGRIPWNAVAVTGVAVLGFGEHAIWMAGAGLETAYLYLLATNPRFQNWVDATGAPPSLESDDSGQARRSLISRLQPAMRQRLAKLEAQCQQILTVIREGDPDSFLLDGNQQALDKLSWLFLKLLVAQNTLQSMEGRTTENELNRQIFSLEQELSNANISPTLRDSKQATLKITKQRLGNFQRRSESLQEITSDLNRIEAQVELALEDATMKGKPTVISSNIDLVSNLLDDSYGESSGAVAALEQTYTTTTGGSAGGQLEN